MVIQTHILPVLTRGKAGAVIKAGASSNSPQKLSDETKLSITPVPENAVFLLVEDNNDDVELLKRAFAKCRVANPLMIVNNGAEALDYLKGLGRYRNRQEFPLPRVMLLDLKMPGIDGFDVLRWLREQPQLSGIRTVVLTSSDAVRDVNLAYQLGAHSFLMKPTDLDDLVRLTAAIQGYWIWTDAGGQLSSAQRQVPR